MLATVPQYRPWRLDISAVSLFLLTVFLLIAAVGGRPGNAQRLASAVSAVTESFTSAATQTVSIDSQRRILAIVSGE